MYTGLGKLRRKPINPITLWLDLELLNQPLKVAPEGPRNVVPERSSFRVSPGPDSAALDLAPQILLVLSTARLLYNYLLIHTSYITME